MDLSQPLFDPSDFRIAPGITHVCAGGETPFLHRHDAAFQQYAADKSRGMAGRKAQGEEVQRARQGVAALWGVDWQDVGFAGSVAEGISMVAESIDWRPGDNVCVDANEYPSVASPFAVRRFPEIELRLAAGNALDRHIKQVNARTRVIGVSYISYLTGERFDLSVLRQLADSVGAILIVDFTQAAGNMPIDASVADFGFSACYKWMLGTTGTAIAYWNRARQPNWQPTTAGWPSIGVTERPNYAALKLPPDATRFTRGNPAHCSIYVLNSAIDYLSRFEAHAIQRHVQGLTVSLHDKLRQAGIKSVTPADPLHHGASVCIETPHAEPINDGLARRGIYAWSGRGRIRFSFHGFNAASDVDRIMEALKHEWRT